MTNKLKIKRLKFEDLKNIQVYILISISYVAEKSDLEIFVIHLNASSADVITH